MPLFHKPPAARRAMLTIACILILLGQGLHVVHHHPVAACPGHLDGAHLGAVVGPAPPCPLCLLVCAAAPAVVLAAVFIILASSLPLLPVLPCSRPALALRSRAPPR